MSRTERGVAHRPLFARMYVRDSLSGERRGQGAHRAQLLAGSRGRVIEVGAGNGLNFKHYPRAVTEVVAVEPENHLRELAEQEAERAPVPITVVAGTAEALPVEDASVDAAVVSLVLCSVRDQAPALASCIACSDRAASCASTSTWWGHPGH